ncbi:DUF4262 domain-containing protein [Kineosporia babensis]|uniref:DUF4262 domain-containing protein n=1 Tax=Kineosporia babensis TaxID=499548 RepID=A0A9X1NLZ1_9ACTN|nr:DUF4262 domain-containing protein [Kineosporia babensis]MCD5316770.1 DUF4262 domain-containing protein [Kineosporia babensis]
MCLRCAGWSDAELLAKSRHDIEVHGWGFVHVEGGESAAFTYTVGLTRFHGHPELLVSGLEAEPAAGLLDDLAEDVQGGLRLAEGDRLGEECCPAHQLQLVEVEDPRRLAQAQQIYASSAGLVPALQVVYTDDRGRWPWEPAWAAGHWCQPVFGRPQRP